jgi:hypothetical protein
MYDFMRLTEQKVFEYVKRKMCLQYSALLTSRLCLVRAYTCVQGKGSMRYSGVSGSMILSESMVEVCEYRCGRPE